MSSPGTDPSRSPAPSKPARRVALSGRLVLGSMVALMAVLMVFLYIVLVDLKIGGEERLQRQYQEQRQQNEPGAQPASSSEP